MAKISAIREIEADTSRKRVRADATVLVDIAEVGELGCNSGQAVQNGIDLPQVGGGRSQSLLYLLRRGVENQAGGLDGSDEVLVETDDEQFRAFQCVANGCIAVCKDAACGVGAVTQG